MASNLAWLRSIPAAVLCTTVGALAVLVLCGGQKAEVPSKLEAYRIVCHGIELTGPDGKRTAFMGTAPDGSSRLDFYDARTMLPLASLGVTTAGMPELTLHDSARNERVSLALTEGGRGLLAFSNNKDKLVVGLGEMNKDGQIGLTFFDKEGNNRLGLGLQSNGDVDLQLLAGDGNSRARFAATKEGGASIRFDDGNARSRLSMKMEPDGSTLIRLRDELGKDLFMAPRR
jgi:hypothetical protein